MATSRLGHGNVTTPWSSVRDGREYIVSLSIVENPRALSVLLTDKITAEEWSCQYDFKHIEDLTRRTGSYKPFETFVAMIKSAILKNTDSVSVELYSFEDLKHLKIQRHNRGIIAMNEFVGSFLKTNGIPKGAGAAGTEDEDGQQSHSHISESAGRTPGIPKEVIEKRKFLIISYDAEFDSVNYPLPLTYSGLPDPLKMQNNIKKLQHEVLQLKNANLQLRDQLRTGKDIEDDNHNLRDDVCFTSSSPQQRRLHQLQDNNNHNQHELLQPKISASSILYPPSVSVLPQPDGHGNHGEQPNNHAQYQSDNQNQNQGKVSSLMSVVKALEDRIEAQEQLFVNRIHKLETENEQLHKQVQQREQDEEIYLLKINQLEHEISVRSVAAASSWSATNLTKNNRNRGKGRQRSRSKSRSPSSQSRTSTSSLRIGGQAVSDHRSRTSLRGIRGGGGGSHRHTCGRSHGSRSSSIVSNASPSPSPSPTPRPRSKITARTRTPPPEKEICPRFFRGQGETMGLGQRRLQSVSPLGRKNSLSVPRAGSNILPFDPTAYVMQKKARQQEINRQRIEDIKRSLEESKKRLGLGARIGPSSMRDGESTKNRVRERSVSPYTPFQRPVSNNSRKSGAYDSGSESEARTLFRARQSRSRLRREIATAPSRPRSRSKSGSAQRKDVGSGLGYEPGRHTKFRLEQRRARSLSGGTDTAATASVMSKSPVSTPRSPAKKKLAVVSKSRSKRSPSPSPSPSPRKPGRKSEARVKEISVPVFHMHSELTPSKYSRPSSKPMPKTVTASIDLTKEYGDSNNLLSHRCRTRSFLTTTDQEPYFSESQSRVTGLRETLEILIEGTKSRSRSSLAAKSNFGSKRNSDLGPPKGHRYPEIEAMINELRKPGQADGNGNRNRASDRSSVTSSPTDYRLPPRTFTLAPTGSGVGVLGRGSAYDLIPPPSRLATRTESREVD